MKYDHIPGPPRSSFLFGHSLTMLRAMENDGGVHQKMLEWLNTLPYIIICVLCPETTKDIMMSPKYPKGELAYRKIVNLFGQRFLGNGLVTALDHEKWYKQRRIIDPVQYLRSLMGTFNERAEKLISKLSDAADNKTETNMLQLFNGLTLDVIAKVAYGVDLDLLQNITRISEGIDLCLKGMIYYVRDVFFEFKPKNKPFINKVREACHLLCITGAQWIRERKTAMQNGEDVPKDILTQIIKVMENMTEEDEELMLDNFVTFLIVGQETTANLLAFLCHVLKETLRLYSTAPGMALYVPEDRVIIGIHIPGGNSYIFNSYVSGRLNKFFPDPLTFDPDRFHPDAPKPYYSYYPFALGPRSCLGQNFAQIEAKVVMAKLLQRFDFTLVPGQSFCIQDNGTLKPKSGTLCYITHRNYD
ncbi:hypothetical protein Q5P01_005230 [Channa striata]|uniref:Uncharacterized protein n=1 Tax=Channa striata TaxID=64152 RepID=A0AA88T136_CHASR|nr:hypothetical protein Q5P01_005230 [Channa striata]